MKDVTVVEDFHDSASSEDDEPPLKRRRRGPNGVWVKKKIFQSYDEAEKYVGKNFAGLKKWTKAFHWTLDNRIVLQDKSGSFFVTSASSSKPITVANIAKLKTEAGKWKSFDQFKKHWIGIHEMKVRENDKQWSCCTCAYFQMPSCEHVLGMFIRRKLTEEKKKTAK